MKAPRYVLKKKSRKVKCPDCNKNTFVPFIDTETGDQLPVQYGRCDRESNCGYYLSPYKDGYNKPSSYNFIAPRPIKQAPRAISNININVFKHSRTAYHKNYFIQWLNLVFGPEITSKLISRYHIGTSKHWPGATIFWQIDTKGKIRSGKIMLYNPTTGRRVKYEDRKYITWVHSVLKLKDFELTQCLFGEHLLKQYPASPVAIVESEKTAIIASVHLPRFIWLAVGSLSNLTPEKCKALAGRKVCLFPDLNGFDKWKAKAGAISDLMPGTSFQISDFLQTNAPEADKQKGLDIADYLITIQHYKPSIDPDISQEKTGPKNERASEKSEKSEAFKKPFFDCETTLPESDYFKPKRKEFTPLWDATDLEADFKALPLPGQPLRLNKCTTICNVQNFIDSHTEIIKHNNGNRIFAPYYQRLIELKHVLKTENNGN